MKKQSNPRSTNTKSGLLKTNMVITALFVVFAYWIMAVKNGFMLRWYDEMSLFESGPFFLRDCMHYPGGLLRYAGAFLTQFMYYPFLGTTLLLILWILMAWLTRIAFRLGTPEWPFTLLVPIALMVSIVQLDEAWLSIKTTGYIYSNTLGFLFTIIGCLVYSKVEDKRWPAVPVGLLIAACYCVAGYYALLSAAVCILWSVVRGIRLRDYPMFIDTAAILLAVILVPRAYYTYFPGSMVDNDYPYLKGLPELLPESYDMYLWWPFIVASGCILLLGLLRISGNGRWRESAALKWGGIAAVAAGMIWGVVAERKSEHLRATVLMLRCVENNDWQGVLHIMSLIKEPPNYSMLVLGNLAAVNLGGTSQDLSGYRPFNADRRHSERFTMTAFVEVPVNYHIGRLNQSYRWAMEHSVQYGKRVYFLRYMIKDALLRGELNLAKKYNGLLLSTMFHRRWAQEMQRYIDDPSLIATNRELSGVISIIQNGKGQPHHPEPSESPAVSH